MATLLGDKNVGDIVKIYESGTAVNYIIVQKGKPSDMYDDSCDGVWLLRETSHSNHAWDGSSGSYYNDYENSDIKTWLNGTFLNTIDEKIRVAIKTVKIPFKKGTGDASTGIYSGSNGLRCKIFLLGAVEVGFTASDNKYVPADGAKLSYFESATQRMSKDYTQWWLRSVYPLNNTAFYVKSGGELETYGTYANLSVRPALILDSSLSVSSDGTVSTNSLPEITSDTPNGTDLGEISESIELNYTVNDADGDAVSVKEYLDGTLKRTYTASLGSANTFECVTAENWQTILNGTHTLKIVANDGKANSNAYTVTFNKQVRTASVSLAEPLPADDVIKAAAIAVTGLFPEDSTLTVLVTNNALDDSPVWEDMTASVMNNSNHVFTNQTAENGFAFNFRITATRGVSDEQGYISSIGGAFE